MSRGTKVRSSSAHGRLETRRVPSFLAELEGAGETEGRGAAGDVSEARGASGDGKRRPDWLLRELLKRTGRGRSVTPGEDASAARRRRDGADVIHRLCSVQTDEMMSLDDLQNLKLTFEEAGGLSCIDAKTFGRVLRKCLSRTSDAQVQGLFKKMDCSGRGTISWAQVCTHLLQRHKEREEGERRRKRVEFALPAAVTASGHGVPVVNIRPDRDGSVVTVREDGAVCVWSPELKPLKNKHVFNHGGADRKSKWVSDFTLMSDFNKLMVGTGDRELQLHELSTLEPYCRISALDSVPLTLDCSCTGPDECCVLYGDTEGCVTILLICSVGDTLRLWNKFPKVENVPDVTMDDVATSPNVTFVRWKVHGDWVTQARYFHSFRVVVSSSDEDTSSLVIGRVLPLTDAEQQLTRIRETCYEGKTRKVTVSWTPQVRASCDQTAFSVYKGVKTFDLCRTHSLLVTGGMDKVVRMWNPHFPGKPTGVLKGHSAPIMHLCISSEDRQIFSVSIDGTVKIWDVEDQCCLVTAESRASGIHGEVAACSYASSVKSLFVAADGVAALSLRTRPRPCGRASVSHEEPVTCCGYSEEFRQVVSCADGCVRVWDLDTGRQAFEFGGSRDHVVTSMTFDLRGRRLVTGGRDGQVKIWNFNSGQCLKTLRTDGARQEVCDCIFVNVRRNSFVVCVGRDRRIHVYADAPEDHRHVRRPQPAWPDDQTRGHTADVLCVAHRPPSLLATGGYDGEIIVWNAVSGRIQCRCVGPGSAGEPDTSVPSIVFLENLKSPRFSSGTALVSSGPAGSVNMWNVLSGGTFVSSFTASRLQQKITRLDRADTLLYAADRTGFVYVYDMSGFDPARTSLRAERFWRAHSSSVSGLQVLDSDGLVLTSSTDGAVRLWTTCGEFIGTFGQPESWSVHTPSSWTHPAVPYEVLIHPLSVPGHGAVNATDWDEAGGAEPCEEERAPLHPPDVQQNFGS